MIDFLDVAFVFEVNFRRGSFFRSNQIHGGRLMESPVRVFAYGSLRTNLGVSSLRVFLKLYLAYPVQLVNVLKELDIAPDSVQLAMVNHRAVPKTGIIRPGDRIALFPKEYPIFADWVSLRMPGTERPADLDGD